MLRNEIDEGMSGSSADDTTTTHSDAAPVVDSDSAAAASSTANGANDEDSSLNIVRDVVDERDDGKSKSAASPTEGEEGGQGEGVATNKDRDNETYADVPFHKHPRFVELINERNGFREDAVRYRNVQSFLDQNAMTGEEAANVLSSVAKAKFDPVAAWNEVKPWVQKLLVAAGEVLSDDLAQEVQAGKLTEEAAFRISRERAQGNSARARLSFDEQRRQRQADTDLGTSLYSAANAWEQERRAKDPNFETKLAPLQREVAFLQMQEGKPKDVAGVQDQLKRAYDAVNKMFGATGNRNNPAPAPRKRPAVRPIVGGQVSGNVQAPEPKNTLDIIRANRRRPRA